MKNVVLFVLLQLLVTVANADCFVERDDVAGVLRCDSGGKLTIKVECLETGKGIAARCNDLLSARDATFSIGKKVWSTDLIGGKTIRLAGFNKRKNDQDFHGLGHDLSEIVGAMKKGRDITIEVNQETYVISLTGFTKSYNQICL